MILCLDWYAVYLRFGDFEKNQNDDLVVALLYLLLDGLRNLAIQ